MKYGNEYTVDLLILTITLRYLYNNFLNRRCSFYSAFLSSVQNCSLL